MTKTTFLKRLSQTGTVLTHAVAGTGTEYITWGYRLKYCEVTIRISDHAECYPPRGRRQISVSPQELTFEQALSLLESPEKIEREPFRADPTPDEKAAIRTENMRREKIRLSWQDCKPLAEKLRDEFNTLGGNRPAARTLAMRENVKVGKLWMALTGGAAF